MNPLNDVTIITTGKIDFALIKKEHFDELFPILFAEAREEHERKCENPLLNYGSLFEDKVSKHKHLMLVYQVLSTLLGVVDNDDLRKVYDEVTTQIHTYFYDIG